MPRFDAFAYMRAVRDDVDLPSTQKHIALMLVTWASHVTGEAHPDHQTIAEATGYNVQTVRKALAALVKCGRLTAIRTARPGGGTLMHYTLRARATSTQDTSGDTGPQGPTGAQNTNGSRPPSDVEDTSGSEASDTYDTSDVEDTSDALDTEPVVSKASLLGNYPGTTSKTSPLTTYARGSNGAEDGQRELDGIEAESRRLDLDDRDGSPDARVLRAIDHLADARVRDRKRKGKPVTSPKGLRRTIRDELLAEQYPTLLGLARTGWSPRELAARAGDANYRPARPRTNGSAA